MNDEKVLNIYKQRLLLHRDSGDVRHALARLDRMATLEPALGLWKQILGSILLIESRERPQFVRAIEWSIATLFPYRKFTCGIFQMHESPFRFESSVREVVKRLERGGCLPCTDHDSLIRIAFVWHGAATKQRGEAFGYSKGLEVAISCLESD